MTSSSPLRAAICIVAAAAAVSCTKPQPPQITAKSAQVTNVSLLGVDILADISAYNPNDIDLEIQSVSAKVTLDKRYDLGTFSEKKPVKLPAKKRTQVKLPIHVQWGDVMGLANLATSRRDLEYLVDGDVELGGEFLRVRIPFQVRGTVTHQQLMQAAGSAIPKIPGLFQ